MKIWTVPATNRSLLPYNLAPPRYKRAEGQMIGRRRRARLILPPVDTGGSDASIRGLGS